MAIATLARFTASPWDPDPRFDGRIAGRSNESRKGVRSVEKIAVKNQLNSERIAGPAQQIQGHFIGQKGNGFKPGHGQDRTHADHRTAAVGILDLESKVKIAGNL